jgi:hypothetical protein
MEATANGLENATELEIKIVFDRRCLVLERGRRRP